MRLFRFLIAVLLLPGLLAAPLLAEENDSIYPDVPKALGNPHPEGNEFWRKNHMDLLLHDRDQTVRLGDREIFASLKGCMVCHAVNGADDRPVGVENPQNFCAVCHKYVSVQVDCFVCHKSTPDEDAIELLERVRPMGDTAEAAGLIDEYLEQLRYSSGRAPPGPAEATQ